MSNSSTSASSTISFLRFADRPPVTLKLHPTVADPPPILFSFRYCNVCLSGFDLTECFDDCSVQSERLYKLEDKLKRLVGIIRLLSSRSKDDQYSIKEGRHCHIVESERFYRCGLADIIEYFPDDTVFFQMGADIAKVSERIFGFFEKKSNVFQVCIIDLYHKIYSKNTRKIRR